MPDATERKVLAASAFIAALMLFPLGGRITRITQLLERVAALSALALAALLFAYHLWASQREARAAGGQKAVAPPAPSLGQEPGLVPNLGQEPGLVPNDPDPPPTLAERAIVAPAAATAKADAQPDEAPSPRDEEPSPRSKGARP